MTDLDSHPDGKPQRNGSASGGFTRGLRAVGGLRVAVILLVVLLIYCVPGVFPDVYTGWFGITQRAYYSHPLLWVLCGLFCVNLLACTLVRVLLARRGSFGMVLTHGSILVLAGGAAWFALGSFDGDLQLYPGERKDSFYTNQLALHVRWPGSERANIYSLESVATHRAGLGREPFVIRDPGGGAGIEVADFLPTALLDSTTSSHPKATRDPMIRCRLGGRDFISKEAWLRTNCTSGDRLTGNGWRLGFRWAKDAAQLDALRRTRPNSRVIHVRFPGTDYHATLSGTVGDRLRIDRFGYLLTVERIEAASACVLRIDSPTGSFRRHLSVGGSRLAEGDPKIETEYSAVVESIWIVADPDFRLLLIHHRQDGSVLEAPLDVAAPRTIQLLDRKLDVEITKMIERPLMRVIVSSRRGGRDGIPALLVRTIDAKGEQWLPLRTYVDHREPLRIPVNGGLAEISFGRTPRKLGFSVELKDFCVEMYPGGEVPKDYASRVLLIAPDGRRCDATVRLNDPANFGGLSLYQGSYDDSSDLDGRMPDAARSTVLSVSHKPGLPLIYLGFAGIVLGVLFSFFVQPLLRGGRRRTRVQNEGETS